MSSLNARDRSRSPRFPSQPLKDSIRHISLIYEGVHRSPIDTESAFQLMGFSGKSGTSAKALGALRQYGLIEGVSDKTRVSDLALKILEPVAENEKFGAIVEASEKPEVFASISQRFDHRIPSADEPLRAYLIRELGFSKRGADDCLHSLRGTMEYVDSLSANTVETNNQEIKNPEAGQEQEGLIPEDNLPSSRPPASEKMIIPLTRNCNAELRFSGELSEKALINLIRHIELMKEVWAEE